MKIKHLLAVLLAVAGLSSCREPMSRVADRVFDLARVQIPMTDSLVPPGGYAASWKDGKAAVMPNWGWCSGFFPGTAWLAARYTGDERLREIALRRIWLLEEQKTRTRDHDLGFQMTCSFGHLWEDERDSAAAAVLDTAAHSLLTRFSPAVGCIRSWNGGHYQVIIDNMMNLELLLQGYRIGGDERLLEAAVSHANTTLAHHFRDDGSSYHVVDYDPESGAVLARHTHQGYADESAWARGQSWGLYGFTMMYRYLRDPAYLAQAGRIADYLLARLPEDGVPYWDYDAPEIPDEPRDASAGAILADALLELDTYLPGKGYRRAAEKTLRTLAGPGYLSAPGENGGFLLQHSVGHRPFGSEVDVPLSYADYYFLEALCRLTGK